MKAALYRDYGLPIEVVRIEEVDPPTPGEGELLIAVRAASINPLDAHVMKGKPLIVRLFFGLRRPKRTRPGVDLAGLVEAIGPGVTRFRPGDAVFGCARGALAEQVCAAEARLALKPATVSFAQAAALPIAGCTALQALRDKARVAAGQKILINGAAGGVGSFAVQIAKAHGAEVTGVCSARNLAMVRAIGADHVIDYGQEDFTRGAARYDIVLDLITNHPFSALRRVLVPGGRVVTAGGPGFGGLGVARWAGRVLGGLLRSRFSREKFIMLSAKLTTDDLAALAAMLEKGEITPVIESCYRLDESGTALQEVADWHARGKVIVEMGDGV